jgi:7-cyano-7-deazaguanine synthase
MVTNIILSSGGIDSAVLLYHLRESKMVPIYIDFMQGSHTGRHSIEALFRQCEHLGCTLRYFRCDLPYRVAPGTEEVTGRNLYLLSSAIMVASELKSSAIHIYIGVHKEDHPYADCTPTFIAHVNSLLHETCKNIEVKAPFIEWTKSEIILLGEQLHVPWQHTWSCYTDSKHHCGKCHSCKERIAGFEEAGITPVMP